MGYVVSPDWVIAMFSGGVSVMLVTSKLCNVRAYTLSVSIWVTLAFPGRGNSGQVDLYLHGMMAQTGCFGCNWVKLARFCRKVVKWETGQLSSWNDGPNRVFWLLG